MKTNLKPGENSEIKVTFYSAGKHGHEKKDIIVYSNDPIHPETTLSITGNIITVKEETKH